MKMKFNLKNGTSNPSMSHLIYKKQSIIESSSNWYLESDYESDFSDAD